MDISYEAIEDGEEWVYGADDDVRMVDVLRSEDGDIQVTVGAAEFVREEPLESRLRTAVLNAILSVEGVESADEEDREVWVVEGDASGEELTRAVGTAIDSMYDELVAHVESLA